MISLKEQINISKITSDYDSSIDGSQIYNKDKNQMQNTGTEETTNIPEANREAIEKVNFNYLYFRYKSMTRLIGNLKSYFQFGAYS
jgi:hypothetical protein